MEPTQEVLEREADAWSTAGVDVQLFDAGQLGPYRVGPSARRTPWGEVLLALAERGDVVEVELYDALLGSPLIEPEGGVMADIAQVAALRHRGLIPMVGAGVQDGVPYVVRDHRLGRTLEALLEVSSVPIEAAAVILHAVSEALVFLAASGPSADACAMGGVTPGDVYLGYDGSIALVGLGLKRVRGFSEGAAAADLASCFTLARALDPGVEARVEAIIRGSKSFADVSRAIRRRFGAACARSALQIGPLMRRAFEDELADDRARFGLPPLM